MMCYDIQNKHHKCLPSQKHFHHKMLKVGKIASERPPSKTHFASPNLFKLYEHHHHNHVLVLFHFSPQVQAFLSFQGCITGTTIITMIRSKSKMANVTHFLLFFWSFLAFAKTAVPASVYSAALATWSRANDKMWLNNMLICPINSIEKQNDM